MALVSSGVLHTVDLGVARNVYQSTVVSSQLFHLPSSPKGGEIWLTLKHQIWLPRFLVVMLGCSLQRRARQRIRPWSDVAKPVPAGDQGHSVRPTATSPNPSSRRARTAEKEGGGRAEFLFQKHWLGRELGTPFWDPRIFTDFTRKLEPAGQLHFGPRKNLIRPL